jgi:hypothetical protein
MGGATNPFEDPHPSRSRRARRAPSTLPAASLTDEPPIWAARHVEWPIPAALSLSNYQKLVKASQQAGQQLGLHSSKDGAKNPTGTGSGTTTKSSAGRRFGSGSTDTSTDETDESNYYGIGGFMSRVLNTSQGNEAKGSDTLEDRTVNTASSSGSLPLRPPRPHCVAAANGWIVAALECPGQSSSQPILRLVSRWNVRRGGGLADQWIALPPPARGDGRIRHVLVDPTASHTLLSAANGELYYIHSNATPKRAVRKLLGFGPAVDGSPVDPVSFLTGIAATAVAHRRDDTSQQSIQKGLSQDTYVTAVAWDKDKGTEGSSKPILLGTSNGEIYEYAVVSPQREESSEDKILNSRMPILLHKLSTETDESSAAAVSGIYVERLRTGLLILVATSGRHQRTRFHTFYSPHSSSFPMVLADQVHTSLTELPGSIEFADLQVCADQFAMRTATGIYYGTVDRTLSSPSVLAGGSSMVMETGLLSYSEGIVPCVSLAVTPHHWVLLTEANEVRYVNRVAQKVIQKERVDLDNNSNSSMNESALGLGSLLMDIRRPDQVWLRKARSLVHISSSQEDRDVWKFTLQKCLTNASTATAIGLSSSDRQNQRKDTVNRSTSVLSDQEIAQEALFEQAKALCTNSAQKAVVTAVRAEYHLSQGRAELAAKYLAQCPSYIEPFADTAIRLALPKLGIDDPQGYGGSWKARASLESSNFPLITYLVDNMRIGKMNEDKMTCTMIGAWLAELYLHERSEPSLQALSSSGADSETAAQHKALLSQFLDANVDNMDAKTIMKILTSHDVEAAECATFATRSGDIATAVNAALSIGSKDNSGACAALKILNEAPFQDAEPLYYKHASIFMAQAPSAATESFLALYPAGLNPLRLLPYIMRYEKLRSELARTKKGLEAAKSQGSLDPSFARGNRHDVSMGSKTSNDGLETRSNTNSNQAPSFVDDSTVSANYLEGVISQGCQSTAVYNYLISLYSNFEDEEPLYKFLSSHVASSAAVIEATTKGFLSGKWTPPVAANQELSTALDLSYALRTILGTGRHFRSAIKLYLGLGMRQQAVELALKVDPSLAREIAQESTELEERKGLWLMIAKNAATDGSSRGGKDVVSRVVSVLRDCGPDVISIEDVLPFL